ncbi:MAG: VCBS domain-containing protein, partial [Oxalobacteraceae bacterium]|nr:VCBS domain-containing protein [Oxalobacteraceae bacterium]
TFSIGAAGVWTYAMNGAHNEFVGGTDYTDSITVATADGTTQVLTVTMHGTNDVPVIGGVSIGAVTEDATTPNLSASGALTIADVDTGESSFVAQAGTAGTHGVFTLDAAGAWTYTADNSQSAIQQLGAGQSITDSFTAFSSDGTASQVVTVTINGTNDVATDIGLSSNSILENADGAVIGALTTTDVDNGDTHTYTVSDDRFEVVDGNLKLKEGVSLDFENKPAVTITVTTTDNHSASFDKEFTINVTDVNEAPTVALPYTGTGDPNDFDGLVGVASGSFTLVNGTDEGDTITPGPAGSDTSKNDKDIINGFAGNDTINAGDATDQVYGGDGDDVINGGDQVDSLYGQAGSDTIHGDAFGDIIYGGSGGDILYGDIADDIIYGGSGSDIIYGGDGNDTIIGGYGADTLSGGGGNDTFMFLDVLDTGDVITDFLPGTDTLDFSAIAGITGIAEAPSSTVTANSINYFQQGNDMIVWADTDGITSTVEFQVTLTGVTATSSDFVL